MSAIFGVFFIVLISVSLLELVLSGLWAKPYFQFGIPIYNKKITYSNKFKSTASDLDCIDISKIIFKDISTDIIGFREKFFEFSFFHYTPLMHGKIWKNYDNQEVQIIGFLNYYPLAFFAFAFLVLADTPINNTFAMIFPIFAVILVAILYLIQKSKFDKIVGYYED
jgi:hypothetical protein